jgi:hypothetical protein
MLCAVARRWFLQTLESVAALASGGLGGEWKAVASEERITSNTTIHEFITLHPVSSGSS